MSENRRHILKSSLGVSFATLLSRLAGLARTMLETRLLGGGVAAGAWGLALMIPNLFRRILGEGALGSALMPLVAELEHREGDESVRRNLAVIFARLSLVLIAIVAVVGLAAWLLSAFVSPRLPPEYEHVKLALKLLPVIMPYAFFICLVGASGAVLATRKVFFLPALGALFFNAAMVGTLAAAHFLAFNDPVRLLDFLALAVVAAGALHLLMMAVLLVRCRRFPEFGMGSFGSSPVLKKLLKLMLPGVIGGVAVQLSFVIDRALAAWLGAYAVASLNYTDRLIDLPIGIFAIAFGSVLMAGMAHSAAAGDREKFTGDVEFGLRHVYFICIPLAAFIIVFRNEIISVLYEGGRFTASDLEETGFATLFYSLGIPVFCAQKVIIPAFHARKEMRSPLVASLIAIAVNVALDLILMFPLRQGGLALATVIAAMCNNAILLGILRKQGFGFRMRPVFAVIVKSLIAAAAAAAAARFLYRGTLTFGLMLWKRDLVPLLIILPIFTFIYTLISGAFRSPELKENLSLLRREGK